TTNVGPVPVVTGTAPVAGAAASGPNTPGPPAPGPGAGAVTGAVPVSRIPRAARAARVNSNAGGERSAGVLAIAVAITVSSAGGTPGGRSVTCGGGAVVCARTSGVT